MDTILKDRLKFLKLIEWMNENDMLNNDLGLIDYEVAEMFQDTDTYKQNSQASEEPSNCNLADVSKLLITNYDLGKFIIAKRDLTDFMKDEQGVLSLYDSFNYACSVRGIYEFDDALILKIEG